MKELIRYIPTIIQLCYAISGIIGVIGAIITYIAMNNEEEDVKRKIIAVSVTVVALIVIAQLLQNYFNV